MQQSTDNNSPTNTITCETSTRRKKELEVQIKELEFEIDISIRYHMKCQNFYMFWHKFITLFTTIFGASSFIILIAGADSLAATITTGIVSLLTILELHIGFIHKYSIHNELYKKFVELDKKLRSIKFKFINEEIYDNQQLNEISDRILNISRKEPSLYKGLSMICHNESCDVLGYNDGMVKIPIKILWLYNYFPFDTWIPEKIDNCSRKV